MNKTFIYVILALIIVLAGWFFLKSNKKVEQNLPPAMSITEQNVQNEVVDTNETPIINNTNDIKKIMNATLNTTKGDITIEFRAEGTPKTVENFVKLAKDGFYDGIKFHRVIKGFMIQGGDPLTKDDTKIDMWGTGGPGYAFEDELDANNKNNKYTIAMANSGPNTNGSQFFINVADNNFLDTKHTVFGKVTAGMNVVDAIANVKTGPNDRPVEAVVIKSISFK